MNHIALRAALLGAICLLAGCGRDDYALPEVWDSWPETPEAPRPLLNTEWKLHDLPASGDRPATTVPPESQVGFVILHADGRHLVGYAGCQPFTALYQQHGERLHIEGLARTGSRCHKECMDDIGDRFATALSRATGYRLATDDALLHLLDGDRITATLIYRTRPEGLW